MLQEWTIRAKKRTGTRSDKDSYEHHNGSVIPLWNISPLSRSQASFEARKLLRG
jgi:hypothetical protein